jgi:ankyrin repeat protein
VNGHEAVVQMLIDRGADVAVKDQKGLTPLHITIQNGHQAVIQILVHRSADIAIENHLG